jgi:hypothetical protein
VSDGRTIWMPKDTGWWRREHVVELGEEFGPVGPAVLDWLSCEAKLQNDGGNVKAGPRTLARGVFSDLVTVRNVLSRAVTIGALHHFEEHDGRFTCTISGWSSDNQRGWNAFRQADYRAKNAEEVTERNALSRPVAPREEKRREEKDNNVVPLHGEANDEAAKELVQHVEGVVPGGVHGFLCAVAANKGVAKPSATAIAKAITEFPDRDHMAVAKDLEFWALEGNGKQRERMALGNTYRNFLKRATPTVKATKVGGGVLSSRTHCKRCANGISSREANNQSGLCDPCFAAWEADREGAQA